MHPFQQHHDAQQTVNGSFTQPNPFCPLTQASSMNKPAEAERRALFSEDQSNKENLPPATNQLLAFPQKQGRSFVQSSASHSTALWTDATQGERDRIAAEKKDDPRPFSMFSSSSSPNQGLQPTFQKAVNAEEITCLPLPSQGVQHPEEHDRGDAEGTTRANFSSQYLWKPSPASHFQGSNKILQPEDFGGSSKQVSASALNEERLQNQFRVSRPMTSVSFGQQQQQEREAAVQSTTGQGRLFEHGWLDDVEADAFEAGLRSIAYGESDGLPKVSQQMKRLRD